MERLISASGLLVFIGLGYVLSVNRRAIRWQPVLWGIALQLILAVLILRTAPGLAIFEFLETNMACLSLKPALLTDN